MFKKIKVLRIINFLLIALCFSLFFVSVKVNAGGKDPGEEVSYTVGSNLIGAVSPEVVTYNELEYGARVRISSEKLEDGIFMFWTNCGKVISTSPTLENFPIYGGERFEAYFKSNEQPSGSNEATVYMDANNDLLGVLYPGQHSLEVPDPSSSWGYVFKCWANVFSGGEGSAEQGRTDDNYLIATYTAPESMNLAIDNTADAEIKIGCTFNAEELAFIVTDVKLEYRDILEMGVIYNTTGDPRENSGTNKIRALKHSDTYEFAAILPFTHTVYAYAYAVLNDNNIIYSRLLTVEKSINITYELDSIEHLETREDLVTRFSTVFASHCGQSTDEKERQKVFWANETMYTEWKWLLEYFYSLHTNTDTKSIYDQLNKHLLLTDDTYYIVPHRDLEGFKTETHFSPSPSKYPSIDFTIPSNAYSYGNTGQTLTYSYSGGALKEPYKVGYRFAGWEKKGIENGIIVTLPIETVTLKPTWTLESYDIAYIKNGGSLALDSTKYTVDSTVTFEVPTKVGYNFLGWYDNAAFDGSPFVGIARDTRYGDVTFYAKWSKPVEYTITYNLLEVGTFTPSHTTYTVESADFVLEKPTSNKGWTFGGWFTEIYCTGEQIEKITNGSHGNLYLYSKWTLDFKITQYNTYPSTTTGIHLSTSNSGSGECYALIISVDGNKKFQVSRILTAIFGNTDLRVLSENEYAIFVKGNFTILTRSGIRDFDKITFSVGPDGLTPGAVDITVTVQRFGPHVG